MYRITIEKVKIVPQKQSEWVKLWDKEVYQEMLNAGKILDPNEQTQHSYRVTEGLKEITQKVYTQEVDSLDLRAIIIVVNATDPDVHAV